MVSVKEFHSSNAKTGQDKKRGPSIPCWFWHTILMLFHARGEEVWKMEKLNA